MLEIEKAVFLTFDIEWACDDVLAYTIEILETANIPATLFVTHQTALLKQLRANPNIELGIHPNFNGLLCKSGDTNGMEEIIASLKLIAPEAVSVRSHSLVQSSQLLDCFCRHGLTHDVNMLIPAYSGIELRPFRHLNGMLRIPYFWEDDVHCAAIINGYEFDWEVDRFLNRPGLKVFNFHPIHILLNTEDLQRYESTRAYHCNSNLRASRCLDLNQGTRVFLMNLITEARRRGMNFSLISEIKMSNYSRNNYPGINHKKTFIAEVAHDKAKPAAGGAG